MYEYSYFGENHSSSDLCTQPRYLIATPRPFHSPLKIGRSMIVCVTMDFFIDSWILQLSVPISSDFVYNVKLLVYRLYFVAICDTRQAHVHLDRFSLQLNIGDFLIRVIKSRKIRMGGIYGRHEGHQKYIYILNVPRLTQFGGVIS